MRSLVVLVTMIGAACGGSPKEQPVVQPQPVANAVPEPAPEPQPEPKPVVAEDPPMARSAGVLGSTTLQPGGTFASLTGTGDISSGFDDTNTYGGLPDVKIGEPKTKGKLGKAVIRRHVKQNIAKITYCYEKQLLADATLAGKLEVQFTIEADGTVSAATASGVHADIESCVAEVIKGIEFPKPKRGTVQVTYPFELRSTGVSGVRHHYFHLPARSVGASARAAAAERRTATSTRVA